MRLECGKCVVRDWARSDKGSVLKHANNRNVWRNLGLYAKSGQFGYWLGEPCWGRGIMTQAVGRVVPYVFSRFPLVRLESPVFAWNAASMRVLPKCGFVREGVKRSSVFKDGQIIDQVVYARLAQ